ncbi:hypothetical protein [Butyrivibrio sp.]|uniref:hypothetical protein n=1 Tax=Butyrivibrio sp. TaxID=28121 RepID=UPI0025C32C74|nr:hypothetical protein [Butyrivibrio sp.]MBQ9302015.1 hypothetical protein [Butyrivibrio sp.]
MITAKRGDGTSTRAEFSFKGLAADTKPTGTYQGIEIENGSSFLELDTKTIMFYDEASQSWV